MALPPGLEGFVLAQQAQERKQGNQLQQLNMLMQLEDMVRTNPLKYRQLQQQLEQADANAKLRQQLGQYFMGGTQQAQGAGDPAATNDMQGNNPRGRFMGVNPMAAMLMLSGDSGMGKVGGAIQESTKPMSVAEGGSVYVPGSGEIYSRPKLGEGLRQTPGGGTEPIPGYGESRARIEGGITGAKAAAEAPYQPPIETIGPNGEKVFTPRPAYAAQSLPRVGGGTVSGIPGVPPRSAVGPTPADTASAVETGKGRAEAGIKFEGRILDNGASARSNLTQLQVLAPNLEKLPSGPLYPMLVGGAAYLKQFGIDVGQISKDLGPAQATNAILNRLALQIRGTKDGEGGMPGAMSDKDREFLMKSVPNLGNTQDGNRQLIKILMTMEERKIEEAQIVSRMQADRKSSNEIREALNQFGNSRPMFGR
jgi:hypothetical protein